MLEDNGIWTIKKQFAAFRGTSQEKPKQILDFMRKKGAAGPDSNGDADSWPGLVHPANVKSHRDTGFDRRWAAFRSTRMYNAVKKC